MLKAVRLDDDKYKEIIDFINNYKDQRGKVNESAAIRELLITGYKNINPDFKTKEKIQQIDINKLKMEILEEFQHNSPDINQIKSQIREELINEMNLQRDKNIDVILDKLNKLEQNNAQPIYIQKQFDQQQIKQENKSLNQEIQPIVSQDKQQIKKQVNIPVDTNPLLANILANANR